jgi:hypothetical protein
MIVEVGYRCAESSLNLLGLGSWRVHFIDLTAKCFRVVDTGRSDFLTTTARLPQSPKISNARFGVPEPPGMEGGLALQYIDLVRPA